MSVSFNLLDEPFIPVLFADNTAGELGVRGIFQQAPLIAEIRDDSPLVTIAIHRFLLAILHRVYGGPKTPAERLKIRSAGVFDQAKLDAYFQKWHDRFDLFHAEQPFLQRAGFKTKSENPSGINRLCQERSRGNNAAMFDHTIDDPPPALTVAQAARVLFAEQAFAVGGGNSDTGNLTHAPLVSGAVVLAYGDTLFETLWLNLTIYKNTVGTKQPVQCVDEDAPLWERKSKPPHEQHGFPVGYLDYLVWPTRTLALIPETEDGVTRVRKVYYAQGRKLQTPVGFFDPMIAYFRTKEAGDKPLRFNEFRDLWRDSAALFQFEDNASARGPNTLHTLQSLPANELPRAKTYRLSVIGLGMDSRQAAKVLFWRHDTLPLRLEYLDDPKLVVLLKNALAMAEDVGKDAVRLAAWVTAKNRLSTSKESTKDSKDSTLDKTRISNLAKSMAPERYYWSRLELPFRQFLVTLAGVAESERQANFEAWYHNWLYELAWQAFERSVATVDRSRDIKAVIAGEKVLNNRLNRIRKKYNIAHLTKPTKAGAS